MQIASPGFLWGLLTISIPIVIHLLYLRRPQRVVFTNTGFIRQVELKTVRRRRLQELLVLLARIAGISFLVLAFAQPFIAAHRAINEANMIAIAIDTSPSMRAASDNNSSLLQEAVRQASLLGKSFGVTTHFKMIGQQGGDLTQASYLAKLAAVSNSKKLVEWNSPAVKQELQGKNSSPFYLFSDFQRAHVNTEIFKKIAINKEILLVPQVAQPVANVYVDSVWLNDAFVRTHVNLGLHIRLRNGGEEAAASCPIKVRIGEEQVAAFSVNLGAGQMTTTVVQVQVPNEQLALGEVVTGDTPIVFDNTYYFALQPTAAVRVVEIGAEPVAQKVYGAEPLFNYSFARPKQLNYADLRRANLVLVNGIASADAGFREALVEVVRRGGSVVVVPPAEVLARAATVQLLQALGVNGGQWERANEGVAMLREVAVPSLRDPFFREVFGEQPRQVVMPQVAPVLHVGRGGKDILRLRDGDSYLTEFGRVGTGRTYVFAAPFAKEYGDFTTQGLFVPVLYRLAMLSYHTNQRLAYRLNEPAISVDLPPAVAVNAAEFKLVRDSLTLLPVQRLRGTNLQLELPVEMSQPGFYSLLNKGKSVTTLAFNAAQKESELKPYSAAELRQLIGPNYPNVRVLDTVGPTALASYRAEQTGQPLWRYCLLMVLVCLLIESLLLRFGRPKVLKEAAVAT